MNKSIQGAIIGSSIYTYAPYYKPSSFMLLASKLGVDVGLENLIRYTMKVHISEIKNANDEVIMTRLSFYDDVLIELNNRTGEFKILGDDDSIKYFKKLVNYIERGNE